MQLLSRLHLLEHFKTWHLATDVTRAAWKDWSCYRDWFYNAAMTIPQTTSRVNIEIIPAIKEQEPVLANLLELYVYDFSEFLDLKLGADGRFGYKRLPLYWEEADRYPFLISVDGHWAGFVFVRKGSEISDNKDIWDMAEFFVVRSCRRLGIGMKVAHEIWNKFPGKWEVRVMDRNSKAREFWGQAISRFIDKTIEPVAFNRNDEACHVFSFESKPAT